MIVNYEKEISQTLISISKSLESIDNSLDTMKRVACSVGYPKLNRPYTAEELRDIYDKYFNDEKHEPVSEVVSDENGTMYRLYCEKCGCESPWCATVDAAKFYLDSLSCYLK